MQEKKIDALELRKNRETNRKFNKQVSDLRKQEKNQATKAQVDAVSRFRKGQDAGGADDAGKEGRLKALIEDKRDGGGGKSFKRQGRVTLHGMFLPIYKFILLSKTIISIR